MTPHKKPWGEVWAHAVMWVNLGKTLMKEARPHRPHIVRRQEPSRKSKSVEAGSPLGVRDGVWGSFGVMECFRTRYRWYLHSMGTVLSATGSCTLKWSISHNVNFTSIKEK